MENQQTQSCSRELIVPLAGRVEKAPAIGTSFCQEEERAAGEGGGATQKGNRQGGEQCLS